MALYLKKSSFHTLYTYELNLKFSVKALERMWNKVVGEIKTEIDYLANKSKRSRCSTDNASKENLNKEAAEILQPFLGVRPTYESAVKEKRIMPAERKRKSSSNSEEPFSWAKTSPAGGQIDKFASKRLEKKIRFENAITDALETMQDRNDATNKIPERSSTLKLLFPSERRRLEEAG